MIFIIDDDKYVLRAFQILLKSAGLEAKVFQCVEGFLEVWEHSDTDLLILDVHMPGMNGNDLLVHLDENKSTLPVIVITAYDETESRELARKYGALAYFTKPVDSEALISAIRSHYTSVKVD